MKLRSEFIQSIESSENSPYREYVRQLCNEFYNQQPQLRRYPGISVSLSLPNGECFSTAVGYADINHPTPLTTQHLFQIGSVTKVFTAVVVLLIEQNIPEFDIDRPIKDWLPQNYQEAFGHINIKQLLNHTSGLVDYIELPEFKQSIAKNRVWDEKEILALSLEQKLLFTPGKKWSYSNTNYFLIKLIMDNLLNHYHERHNLPPDFNKYLNWLINHLKLENTHFITSLDQYKGLLPQISLGYAYQEGMGFENDQDVTDLNLSYAGAAGAIVSNSSDITRFLNQLLVDKNILTETQLEKMQSCVRQKSSTRFYFFSEHNAARLVKVDKDNCSGYGLGLIQQYTREGLIYCHSGATFGYQCEWACFAEDGTIITIMGNHDLAKSTLGKLIMQIKSSCNDLFPKKDNQLGNNHSY